MNSHPFTLVPFPGGPARPYQISGSAARQGTRLTLAYALTGELADVEWPAPAEAPARQDHLWHATCCEFFWAPHDSPGYWEANLSPAGHWQLYRFDDYRVGGRAEPAVSSLPIRAAQRSGGYELRASLDLAGLVRPEEPLCLAISVVVALRGTGLAYWALVHPGSQPDFHQRGGFRLAL